MKRWCLFTVVYSTWLVLSSFTNGAAADVEDELKELKLMVKKLGAEHKQQAELIEKLQADVQDLHQRQEEKDSAIEKQAADIQNLQKWQLEKDEVIKKQAEEIQKLQQQQEEQRPQDIPLNSALQRKLQNLNTERTRIQADDTAQRDRRSDDTTPLEAIVSQLSQRMESVTAQMQSLSNAVTHASNSVYTRWGNSACPNGAQLMYSGLIGGASYAHSGGATNSLCLPLNPVYQTNLHMNMVYGYATLYGTEYETRPEPSYDRTAVCSVCQSSRRSNVMIPVTTVCPSGWTKEYSGFIMAERPDDGRSGTEYICVDSAIEGLLGTEATNMDEHVLYFTKTHCGSLPCPPFVEGQVVACVVCSQ